MTFGGFVLHVNLTTISFLYLLLVLAMALLCGFWQASLLSVLAVACLDYFFTQPLFHFYMTDSQEIVALGVFEITTIVVSRLSAKELRSSGEAAAHRAEMEQLYELSRNSLLMDMRQAPGTQLVVLIQRIFGTRAVAFYDLNLGRQDRAGEWDAGEEEIAKEAFLCGVSRDSPDKQLFQRVLMAGSGLVGALVIRGDMSLSAVDALASLAAIVVDRQKSFEREERAENAQKSEQLRAAVLDALAHQIKTPLTAVKTASSGLLEIGVLTDLQRELVTLIDSEAARVNELCTRLLLTAKLDGKMIGLRTDDVVVQGLLSELVSGLHQETDIARIHVTVEAPALTVQADRELLSMIVTEFIDNACKYSTPGSPIDIIAWPSQTEVLISVHNHGSTIRLEDRERVFDRFYRTADQARGVSGTGIGLSVVKKAAEAHHGHVWVISDEGEGTTFYLSLPIGARRWNE